MLLENFSKWFSNLIKMDSIIQLVDVLDVKRDVFFDKDQVHDLIVLLGTDNVTTSEYTMTKLVSPVDLSENVPDSWSTIFSAGNKEINIGSQSSWNAGRFQQSFDINECALALFLRKFEDFTYYPSGTQEITGYEVQVATTAEVRASEYFIYSEDTAGLGYLKIPRLPRQEVISCRVKGNQLGGQQYGITFVLRLKDGTSQTINYVYEPLYGSPFDGVVVNGNLPAGSWVTKDYYLYDVCSDAGVDYSKLSQFDVIFWVNSTEAGDYASMDIDYVYYRLLFLLSRVSVADGDLSPISVDPSKSLTLTYQIKAI